MSNLLPQCTCGLKGYWLETSGDEVYICVKVRHNGKREVLKIPLSKINNEIQK